MLRQKEKAAAVKEGAALRFLYNTVPGRVILKPLASRAVSKICGRFLDSRLSIPLIAPFVKKHGIDLDDYCCDGFKCFNDFFTRKIKDGKRPIDSDPDALISPCDGLLSVYSVTDGTVIPIKQSRYTVSSLLGGDPVAEKFSDGVCLVFRLCVDNYHRYCYIDDGIKLKGSFIAGKLHTVRPIALEKVPVFTENCREYTVIRTKNFGDAVQIEVGAMLVGKIKNHRGAKKVKRGNEKGMFLYGGSTVVVLLQKDAVRLSDDVLDAAKKGVELPVKMGCRIGQKIALNVYS